MECKVCNMKIIVFFAVLGLALVYFQNSISAFLNKEFKTIGEIRDEEVALQSMLEKFTEEKTETLLKSMEGNISESERRAIQIVLQKREAQINNL